MQSIRFTTKMKGRGKIMIQEIKDQWGQTRKRAVLVDRLNKKCLDMSWRPLISEAELAEATHRLDEDFSIWQWQWVGNLVNLAGAIDLAGTENAELQFGTSGNSV